MDVTSIENVWYESDVQAEKGNRDKQPLHDQEKDLRSARYASDTKWRCIFSWWVVAVDSVWLLSVLAILVFNNKYLGLSDAVIMTILGTTTLNVLGLAFIVLKGMFSISHKEK